MKKTLILFAMVVALVILPFFVDHGGEFGGSDGEAESQIQVVAPHYEPLYEPASGEIESLLFTLQGSLGAAVIFYILGYSKGRQRRDDRV